MSALSDEALLAAYRRGDTSAFEALLARYRHPLFNFVLRFVRDRGPAEELYQDTWLKVIERCDDFRGDSKFSTWLYTIARNLCVDHQRKMRFRAHASLEAPNPGPSPSVGERAANPGPSTEQLAAARRTGDRIVQAVQALPDEQREVFLLRQIQALAFHEIAEIVGVPANTVKSRMRYALERLRRELDDLRDP
ncbi:MAG TPA: RNA polymerase sigma factor [Polyangiales bacterium]|nr:RNA polymerase sigma factor [Polyangiales bacterium]